MIISVDNVEAAFAEATMEERTFVRDYLTVREKAYTPAKGHHYRYTQLLHAGRFPAGLAGMVRKAGEAEGLVVRLVDTRARPCSPDLVANLDWLRPYQRAAVEACIAQTRGIVHAPTGAGKTEVFGGVTTALPCRWLMLVHRNGLVRDAADRAELRTGEPVGRIGEGFWTDFTHYRVICASFQTLAAKLRKGDAAALALLEAAQGIIVDECHTLPAATHLKVVGAAVNAYFRIGMSGTPLDRGDSKGVVTIGALGEVIYRIEAETLVEAGVLAKPVIRMHRVAQAWDHATPIDDWHAVYRRYVVESAERNQAVVAAVHIAEKPCLVFVQELGHGRALEKLLTAAGLSATFVHGAHSTEWRRSHIKRLQLGHFDVMVASIVMQEGVDIPDLRSVVVATAGKSVIGALQRIGRGMRVAPGKTTFEVHDIDDVGVTALETQSAARARAYRKAGFSVG
jgi:superfamily II DNA or RNA helicase